LAVIDIGSNSVRLVIYDIFGAHFTPVYNEKILAGLGRDLRRTGKLSVEGKQKCRAALARFSHIIAARGLKAPLVGATAALRVAEDAPDFVASIRAETGLDISPISGEEEARLAALGLLSSNARRVGVGADLGGASLEIMRIDPSLKADGAPVQGVSLPLGPFDAIGGKLSELKTQDYAARIADLDAALAKVPGYLDGEDTLYLVGGAWRNLAATHQQKTDYPMRTLQGYKLSAKSAAKLAHWAWTDGIEDVLNWPGMRKARAETLPYAGLMLERLLKRFTPKFVVISMAGLREGLVWNTLSETVKSRDALIDGCRDFARGFVQAEHFGPPLYRFLSPLLPNLPSGFGETENARMSLSLFRTYTAKRQPPVAGLIDELLIESQRHTAACIGEAIRLGIVVTGRTPSLLSEFNLEIKGEELHLLCGPDRAAMVTAQVRYRLAKLAKLLNLTPVSL